jgi:hypothetical protein
MSLQLIRHHPESKGNSIPLKSLLLCATPSPKKVFISVKSLTCALVQKRKEISDLSMFCVLSVIGFCFRPQTLCQPKAEKVEKLYTWSFHEVGVYKKATRERTHNPTAAADFDNW